MKLETHTSRFTLEVLKDWKDIIHDLTTDSNPVFRVHVKGLAINLTIRDLFNLMDLNILEDCSLSIDTDGGQHEITIRDTFEKL